MRNANGTGSIHKLTDKKRRNPWRVQITTGWRYDIESGRAVQSRKTLGYYPRRIDAEKALIEYRNDPYDLDATSLTFSDVYGLWSEEHFKTLSNSSSIRTWTAAYKHCVPLHNTRFCDLKVRHLEDTIENATVGLPTKARMKSLFNLLYAYALKHEIVQKNYAQLCNKVTTPPAEERIPFSQNEIQSLWEHKDSIAFADMILIGIYSGWRPQELAILETANIDLEQNTMFGGLKTNAGKNRLVPIHPLIQPLIEKYYDPSNKYLFNDESCSQGVGKQMTYDKYRNRFNKVMKELNLIHRPHETRHTFVTKAKFYKMDENILKKIVGHTAKDITERIYTHRVIEELRAEMNKIIE